jgi:hypothetical protein
LAIELNQTYRDILRRGTVSAFVDLEGWIVWIQEYLRYRANACSHTEASSRVFAQIAGGGVLPVCATGPTDGGSVTFVLDSASNACSCWFGTITLFMDGVARGSMTCSGNLTIQVSPGRHTYRICDREACLTDSYTAVPGIAETVTIRCVANGAGGRSVEGP